jgi:glycosyltransferase involved in cell wall biosynthesis
MRIGINLVTIIPGEIGGIETYTNQTIKWLTQVESKNTYVLLTNKQNHQFYSAYISDRVSTYQVCDNAQQRLKRLMNIFFILPFYCQKLKLNLLFSPGNIAPLWTPCKSVVSLLDAAYPGATKGNAYEKIQRLLYTISAFGADSIVTISKNAAQDIINYCYVNKNKITITKLGPGVNNKEIVSPDKINHLKQQFSVSKYILSLGSLIDRKNYPLLIEAFANLDDKDISLIIVGHAGPAKDRIDEAIKVHGLEKRVIIAGYVPGSLEVLYKGAELYVQAAYYEGFGLPVLEAMVLGVPVISSNSSSLPEVGGNAVLYFNAFNRKQLTKQMNYLLDDFKLQKSLIQKGFKQAKLFSWQKNAEIHLNVFNSLG